MLSLKVQNLTFTANTNLLNIHSNLKLCWFYCHRCFIKEHAPYTPKLRTPYDDALKRISEIFLWFSCLVNESWTVPNICEGGVLLLVFIQSFLGNYFFTIYHAIMRITNNSRRILWRHLFFSLGVVSNISQRRLLLSTKLLPLVRMVPGRMGSSYTQVFEIHLLFATWRSMKIVGSCGIQSHKTFSSINPSSRSVRNAFCTFTQLHYFPSPQGGVFPYYIQLHRHILYYPTYCIVKYLTSQHGDGILPGPVFMLPGNQVYSKLVCMQNFILMP